jgi:hypothetical protein
MTPPAWPRSTRARVRRHPHPAGRTTLGGRRGRQGRRRPPQRRRDGQDRQPGELREQYLLTAPTKLSALSTCSRAIRSAPIYVDRVTAARSRPMRRLDAVLFESPYVLPPPGRQSRHPGLVAFSVRSVFTNPGMRGSFPWNGVFVPYTPGTGNLNQANTAQSSSFVRLPVKLTMSAKRQRRGSRTFAVVTACVTEAGQGVRGISVVFRSGATAATANSPRARRIASGRTNARGCVTRSVRVQEEHLSPRERRCSSAPGAAVPADDRAEVLPAFGSLRSALPAAAPSASGAEHHYLCGDGRARIGSRSDLRLRRRLGSASAGSAVRGVQPLAPSERRTLRSGARARSGSSCKSATRTMRPAWSPSTHRVGMA